MKLKAKEIKTETIEQNEEQLKHLIEETKNLDEKINKLNAMIASAEFVSLDRTEKDLLYEQQRTMSRYSQILGKRIEHHEMKEGLAKELERMFYNDIKEVK